VLKSSAAWPVMRVLCCAWTASRCYVLPWRGVTSHPTVHFPYTRQHVQHGDWLNLYWCPRVTRAITSITCHAPQPVHQFAARPMSNDYLCSRRSQHI
jgi:hypothetical protein